MLGRDLVMVPKLIHPLPPSTPRSSGQLKLEHDLDDQEPPTPHPTTDTWMAVRASHGTWGLGSGTKRWILRWQCSV